MRFLGKEDDDPSTESLFLETIQKKLSGTSSKANTTCIGSWAPLTTHLLDKGGSYAWNVMDNVITEDNFVYYLNKEINNAQLNMKFPPESTSTESRVNEIRALTYNQFGSKPTDPADDNKENNSNNTNIVVSETGDKSIFIPNKYRTSTDFSKELPCLSYLLRTIQNTVESKLTEYFTFDYDSTTIQIEIYPGDGKSGYLRDFSQSAGGGNKNQSRSKKRMKDIVTVTYIATPEDWDVEQHGGSLRILPANDNSGKNNKNQQQSYYDILPYSNRLFVYRCDSSSGTKHQLLPSRRPRLSITVWYYGYNKRDESQMERELVFIDYKTGSVGLIAKEVLAEHNIIQINDNVGSAGGYTIVEAAKKITEKSKLINMIKDCEKLGLGMHRPKAKANSGFGGEEAQLVAAKWGVALKKRVTNKQGEEMLFLDPNTNTIGEISRTKCISAGIITITKNGEDEEIIQENEQGPARDEILEVIKEMLYTLEFDKHVEQNSSKSTK